MKILLVGNYVPDKQESMQRFVELMQRELKSRGHTVRLIRPAPRFNRSGASPEGRAKWLGYLDKFVLFPFLLKRVARRFDAVHICDHSNALYVHFIQNKPHVVTCNDVLAIRSALGLIPENPTGWSGKILQKFILSGLNKANHIACISMNTRKELLEVSKSNPKTTTVIYMGMNYPYSEMNHSEAVKMLSPALKNDIVEDLSASSFIFHVGGNQWYKNRIGVLKIYRELCEIRGDVPLPKLVMAGKPFDEPMREFVSQHHLGAQVIEVQDCSNEELRAFYSTAQAMLFPSLAEGFGWPVIEAQACGCPVVTSNFAPLTEIGGEAAIYCDPKDETEVARQLDTVLNASQKVRQDRVQGGISNAKRFLPQGMVDSYLKLYQTAMSRRSIK